MKKHKGKISLIQINNHTKPIKIYISKQRFIVLLVILVICWIYESIKLTMLFIGTSYMSKKVFNNSGMKILIMLQTRSRSSQLNYHFLQSKGWHHGFKHSLLGQNRKNGLDINQIEMLFMGKLCILEVMIMTMRYF